MTVGAMLNRVKSFDKRKAAAEAMLAKEAEILDLNRVQLYNDGIGYDSKPLPPYSPAYAKSKPTRGIVDIYRDGTLQKEMELKIEGANYTINSVVPYAKYVAGLRPTIFGLTEISKVAAQKVILPDFVRLFKQWTGLR
jgi:hypothetical protein